METVIAFFIGGTVGGMFGIMMMCIVQVNRRHEHGNKEEEVGHIEKNN